MKSDRNSKDSSDSSSESIVEIDLENESTKSSSSTSTILSSMANDRRRVKSAAVNLIANSMGTGIGGVIGAFTGQTLFTTGLGAVCGTLFTSTALEILKCVMPEEYGQQAEQTPLFRPGQ